MTDQEKHIWKRIIEILADNPDVFPITQFVIDSNKYNNLDNNWLKYQLETFFSIQTVFQKYYEALFLFWYTPSFLGGGTAFMDSFNKNIITNVLFHYKDKGLTNKSIDIKFKKITDKL